MPSRDEWVAAVKEGMERFQAMKQENQDSPDLAGADLRDLNLQGAQLDHTNLNGADLRRADLAGANLSFADLTNADLRGAKLVDATVHRATLAGTDFRGCSLGGFDARGRMCLHESSFKGVRWGKEELETILAVLNTNEDWEVRYEVIPRRPS